MNCPACHEPVDDEADLCFACGEPLGAPLPAAPGALAATAAPVAPVPPERTRPSVPTALRKRRADDEDTVRCRGCGVPNPVDRERCRSCGDPLKRD